MNSFSIQSKDRLLIVAPHPDDESIGVGGLLALYNTQCDVMLLTDGRHGHVKNSEIIEDELCELRFDELKSACKIAGVNEIYRLNIKDQELYKNFDAVQNFDITNYDYVFLPNRHEQNIDHLMVYPFFSAMKKQQKAKCKLCEYEVWTPLMSPNTFVDISSVIETKRAMIQQHKTQMEDCDFAKKAIGLSCYRGMHNGCDFAEVFAIESNELRHYIPMPIVRKYRIMKARRNTNDK